MTDADLLDDVDLVDLDDVFPYSTNPKDHPDEQVEKIAASIREYGWDQPIVVDAEGEIVKGHGRYYAARRLGLDRVPVIRNTYDSEAEKRAARLADNRVAESEWVEDDLAVELDRLVDDDFDLELTGFDDDELDDLLGDPDDAVDEDDLPRADDHEVYFEDCVAGMADRLDDDSVDLVFTSPPYNIGKGRTGDRASDAVEYDDDRTPAEFRAFLGDVFDEVARVVNPGGHVFVNLEHTLDPDRGLQPSTWIREVVPLPLQSIIVWHKPGNFYRPDVVERGAYHPNWEPVYHFSTGGDPLPSDTGDAANVWEVPTAEKQSRSGPAYDYGEHPAPFPVPLAERAIATASTPGDRVLDPFMGSGTTAVAAILNDREFVGFELDEQGAYQPTVERRIQAAREEVGR